MICEYWGDIHRDEYFGGPGRNRTDVQGFAVLCITTLPPGHPDEYLFVGSAAVYSSGYREGQEINLDSSFIYVIGLGQAG